MTKIPSNTTNITKNILFLWNDNEYSRQVLKIIYGEDNVITSLESLEKRLENNNNIVGLVILAELNWSGHRLSELYGIDIVKRILRTKYKLKLPILFVSFLSLANLLTSAKDSTARDPHKEIVTTVGHDFLRLPTVPGEWNDKLYNMKPLTDFQLTDIITNFCNVLGLIDESIHRIQGAMRQALNSSPTDKLNELMEQELRKGLLEIGVLLPTVSLNQMGIELLIKRFKEECIKGNKFSDVINFVGRIGEELKSKIPDETTNVKEGALSDKVQLPWQVLLLDDEPKSNNVEMIINTLRNRGVKSYLVSNIRQAEEVIEADQNNQIVVAIADYRLNENIDGIRRHQSKQGYDFLFDVSRKDRLTSLVALSGMSRRLLLESFQKYNTRVAVYSKNDLQNQEAINLFVNTVIDFGSETYEALCSLPSSAAGWKVLKPFYIAYRNSPKYVEWEREISNRAREYVLIVDYILKIKDKELIQNPPLLNKLDNLTAKMEIRNPFNENHMEIFKNKLIGRRVALWLLYRQGFNMIGIYGALSGILDISNLLKGDSGKTENSAKNLINTNLSLRLEDFPKGILIEEKRWFKYEMGADIYNINELLSQIGYHIEVGLEKWLKNNPNLAKTLQKKIDLIGENGKLTIPSFEEGKRVLRMISELLSNNEDIENFKNILTAIANRIGSDRYSSTYLDKFKDYIQKLLRNKFRNIQ